MYNILEDDIICIVSEKIKKSLNNLSKALTKNTVLQIFRLVRIKRVTGSRGIITDTNQTLNKYAP